MKRKAIQKILLLAGAIFLTLYNVKTDQATAEKTRYIVTMPSSAAAFCAYTQTPELPCGCTVADRAGSFLLIENEGVLSHAKQNELVALLGAEAIEPDTEITTLSDDVYFNRQWAINLSAYSIRTENTEEYINKEKFGREVVVAVIDTGVDVYHEDLAPSIWVNKNEIPDDGIDNDGNGYIDDINGWDFYHDDSSVCHYEYDETSGKYFYDPYDSDNHGTHIAGIIAATPDNGIGISGLASPYVNVKIMVLKCLGGGTESSPGRGTMFSTITAIEYATEQGADICNLSWGNDQYSTALYEAIRRSDMLFCTAAGNVGADNSVAPVYPASYDLPNIISIASVGQTGELSVFSNYGVDAVDIAAPGERIISTMVGTYGTLSGTSMATPYVTSVAAMLYATSEHTYPASIKDIIISSGTELSSLEGRIRNPVMINSTVAASMYDSLVEDTEPPVTSARVTIDSGKINLYLDSSDVGPSGIRVIKYLFGKKNVASFHRGLVGLDASAGRNKLQKEGSYSIYVSDYAGNEDVIVIDATERPAEKVDTSISRKIVKTGSTYQLKYTLLPEDNTDIVRFESKDKDIAKVNKNGLIEGISPGRTVITITATNGAKASIVVYVR